MKKAEKIIHRFAQMIDRQFGLSIAFIDLLKKPASPLKDILETVLKYKKARFLIVDNDLIIPITQSDRLYGYVRIFDGVSLHPDQVEHIQMLTDLLIRSVVVTQHKKQEIDNIEKFLKKQVQKKKYDIKDNVIFLFSSK